MLQTSRASDGLSGLEEIGRLMWSFGWLRTHVFSMFRRLTSNAMTLRADRKFPGSPRDSAALTFQMGSTWNPIARHFCARMSGHLVRYMYENDG